MRANLGGVEKGETKQGSQRGEDEKTSQSLTAKDLLTYIMLGLVTIADPPQGNSPKSRRRLFSHAPVLKGGIKTKSYFNSSVFQCSIDVSALIA